MGGGGGNDGSAEVRRQEQERQAQVAAATQRINDVFDGPQGFGPDYYNGVEKAYLDYYMPQFGEQSARARRSVILNSPTRQSSGFNRTVGDLEADIQRNEASIRDNARSAALQKQGEVEQNRAQLLQLAQAGGSVDTIGNQAAAIAKSVSAPQAYSPLADLFTRYTAGWRNSETAKAAGFSPLPYYPGRPDPNAVTVVR
ncbi:MAG: hypothetical protein ACOZDY_11010 [Pseudomonadota bacterium]